MRFVIRTVSTNALMQDRSSSRVKGRVDDRLVDGVSPSMQSKPKLRVPIKKGWDAALTSKNAQLVLDSYKNQMKCIILMSEMDWILALSLELDPNVVRYRYVRDPYWPARQTAPRWRFIARPRNGCTYLIEAFERSRRPADKRSDDRRHKTVYLNELKDPEIILSEADACAYLVAAWDHETVSLENRIFKQLQDRVVRTLRELYSLIGGNHPLFVAALLRQYQTGSIDTNLKDAPLGWQTHVAAFGMLNHD